MGVKYDVKRGDRLVNRMLWLGNQRVQGCENAMYLAGGDLILLKTVKRYSPTELDELASSTRRWGEEFGYNEVANELRNLVGRSVWQQHRGEE